MKPFESFLAPQLNEYLTYRQGLGYTLMPTRAYLLAFDRYLKQTQADWTSFEPAFFLEMTARLTMDSRSANQTVSAVRVFFRFLLRCGYVEENPVRDIPPLKENTIVPFIFSPEQVDQFLGDLYKNQKNQRPFSQRLRPIPGTAALSALWYENLRALKAASEPLPA